MKFNKYQEHVLDFTDRNTPGYTETDASLKLIEEVGELIGLVHKMKFRKDKSRSFFIDEMEKEFGDVLSTLTSFASIMGFNLDLIAKKQVQKLKETNYAQSPTGQAHRSF